MKEYITIEDKQYRVTHSMAAISMFAELTGRKTIDKIADMGEMSPNDLLTMMFCSIYMGEKLEKRKLDFESPQDLGMVVGVGLMQDYVQIFVRQMKADIPVKPGKKDDVKKKRQRWLKLKAWLSGDSQ